MEDNPADVRLIREALRYKGIESDIEHYETATAGIKAVQKIDHTTANLPDIILMDYNLPAGTARDILIAIRNNPVLDGIKKAVLTCSVAPKDREHALEAGADLFVFKPESLDQFLDNVGNALSDLLNG